MRPAADLAAEHIGACKPYAAVYGTAAMLANHCNPHGGLIDPDTGWCPHFTDIVAVIDERDTEHDTALIQALDPTWSNAHD